jgi:alpha-mannosidase
MEDIPNNYDAWDIDSFHLEKQEHLAFKNVRVLENGPLRGVLGADISRGGTTINVKISLDAVAASMGPDARSLIRFDATVDWRASHTILKFEMPTTILAEEAIYDVQFGFVKRPTHRNTSHDAAKFEVCGHTFADVSEYGYGVAILNDCKYGYAACGNLLTLSLLRAPKSPDPDADMGIHEFSWAIYPHLNTFIESDVAEVAAAFNAPMKGAYPSHCKVFSADGY